MTEQWVEGLPRVCWNHYNNDGPRTTNHVEGWHSKLNKLVGHPHPNIYRLLNVLKREQSHTEIRIVQLHANGISRPKKKAYRELEHRLQTLKDRFRNGHEGSMLMQYRILPI